jgi:hypothetical protein
MAEKLSVTSTGMSDIPSDCRLPRIPAFEATSREQLDVKIASGIKERHAALALVMVGDMQGSIYFRKWAGKALELMSLNVNTSQSEDEIALYMDIHGFALDRPPQFSGLSATLPGSLDPLKEEYWRTRAIFSATVSDYDPPVSDAGYELVPFHPAELTNAIDENRDEIRNSLDYSFQLSTLNLTIGALQAYRNRIVSIAGLSLPPGLETATNPPTPVIATR